VLRSAASTFSGAVSVRLHTNTSARQCDQPDFQEQSLGKLSNTDGEPWCAPLEVIYVIHLSQAHRSNAQQMWITSAGNNFFCTLSTSYCCCFEVMNVLGGELSQVFSGMTDIVIDTKLKSCFMISLQLPGGTVWG
jgi:hypothetical protein